MYPTCVSSKLCEFILQDLKKKKRKIGKTFSTKYFLSWKGNLNHTSFDLQAFGTVFQGFSELIEWQGDFGALKSDSNELLLKFWHFCLSLLLVMFVTMVVRRMVKMKSFTRKMAAYMELPGVQYIQCIMQKSGGEKTHPCILCNTRNTRNTKMTRCTTR